MIPPTKLRFLTWRSCRVSCIDAQRKILKVDSGGSDLTGPPPDSTPQGFSPGSPTWRQEGIRQGR